MSAVIHPGHTDFLLSRPKDYEFVSMTKSEKNAWCKAMKSLLEQEGTPQSNPMRHFLNIFWSPLDWVETPSGFTMTYNKRQYTNLEERKNNAFLSGHLTQGWLNGKECWTDDYKDQTLTILFEVLKFLLNAKQSGFAIMNIR